MRVNPNVIVMAGYAIFFSLQLGISSVASAELQISDAFHAMLTEVDAAQRELHNGKPEAFKALWSQADDITLSGGFGGTVEKGWEQISRRLDWVGTQYSNGTTTIERVAANESGDLRYVVQLEHISFNVPAQTEKSKRDYRVTMIFRREAAGWRIIDRQADSNMTKALPK